MGRPVSATREPQFTGHFLGEVERANINYIKVFTPVEHKTGADFEVHIIFPDGSWFGLVIQCKKADPDEDGGFLFKELFYKDGKQFRDLCAYAKKYKLLPFYLFFFPGRLLRATTPGAIKGAMICPAPRLEVNWHDGEIGYEHVFRKSIPFSELLCAIEEKGVEGFLKLLATLFAEPGASGLRFDVSRRTAPKQILQFFDRDAVPRRWRRDQFGGAIVAKLEASLQL
jgi:hypothetical protein